MVLKIEHVAEYCQKQYKSDVVVEKEACSSNTK